jgi:hypothetical protein
MKVAYPFEELNHVPLIYRRDLPNENHGKYFTEELSKRIEARKNFSYRKVLADRLQYQYGNSATPRVSKNIDSLKIPLR